MTTPTPLEFDISPTVQLIPLDGDIRFFETVFEVQSQNKVEFEGVVLDQDQVDSMSQTPPQFHSSVEGVLTGSIRNDTAGPENHWYLALRASQEIKVNIFLETQTIQEAPVVEQPSTAIMTAPPVHQHQKTKKAKRKSFMNWVLILLLVLMVIGAGYGAYWYFVLRRKSTGTASSTFQPTTTLHYDSPSPSTSSHRSNTSDGAGLKKLLSEIEKLPEV